MPFIRLFGTGTGSLGNSRGRSSNSADPRYSADNCRRRNGDSNRNKSHGSSKNSGNRKNAGSGRHRTKNDQRGPRKGGGAADCDQSPGQLIGPDPLLKSKTYGCTLILGR